MAAKREMPLHGKRGPYRGGRVRSAALNIKIAPDSLQCLDALAEAEGVTRTVLIERWISEHAPSSTRQESPMAGEV